MGPKTERLTILRAVTHETELGDHEDVKEEKGKVVKRKKRKMSRRMKRRGRRRIDWFHKSIVHSYTVLQEGSRSNV